MKVVTELTINTTTTMNIEEKYKVMAPEAMQETFMSDSEDEGGRCWWSKILISFAPRQGDILIQLFLFH